MALTLKRQGIRRIRPLAGGIEAWRARAYPVDAIVVGPDAGQAA